MKKPSHKRRPASYTPVLEGTPEPARPLALRPWLRWMRGSLPFDLDHINIWLLEGETGWTLVDTGFNAEDMRGQWEALFDGTLGGKPVEDIFVTHFHPDHYGLAGWLAERTGVTIRMTEKEYGMARTLTHAPLIEELVGLYRPYYTEAGVPEDMAETLLKRRFAFSHAIFKPPADYTRVTPGETVALAGRDWLVIPGHGHSPEHACLYNAADKVLISGDIVLPSHGVPFTGLHQRIAELRTVLAEAPGPLSPYEAMRGLFSHRGLNRASEVFFALGETYAHLFHDAESGEISRIEKDGQALFQTSEK